MIGISERRLKKSISLLSKIDLQNYKIEHTPAESEKGASLLCISSDLNYKVRNDLKMYKAKELDAAFIEIKHKGKKILSLNVSMNILNCQLKSFIINSCLQF